MGRACRLSWTGSYEVRHARAGRAARRRAPASCTSSRPARRAEIRAALARDPWSGTHLEVDAIDPWTKRLDGRQAPLRVSSAPAPAIFTPPSGAPLLRVTVRWRVSRRRRGLVPRAPRSATVPAAAPATRGARSLRRRRCRSLSVAAAAAATALAAARVAGVLRRARRAAPGAARPSTPRPRPTTLLRRVPSRARRRRTAAVASGGADLGPHRAASSSRLVRRLSRETPRRARAPVSARRARSLRRPRRLEARLGCLTEPVSPPRDARDVHGPRGSTT